MITVKIVIFFIFIPILALSIFASIHIYLMRRMSNTGYAKTIFFAFFLGMLFIPIMHSAIMVIFDIGLRNTIAYGVLNAIIFSLCTFCYCILTTLGVSSLRVRMLVEIKKAGQGGLTEEMLLKQYNAKQIISARIERLINNGHIKQIDKKLYMNKHLILVIAYTFQLFRFIVFGKNEKVRSSD